MFKKKDKAVINITITGDDDNVQVFCEARCKAKSVAVQGI